MRLRRSWAALAAATLTLAGIGGAQAADPPVLLHAHAHNDYLNSAPLVGALDHGFTSVEADVWLHSPPGGGAATLMLCHEYDGNTCKDDEGNTKTPAPFASTYLGGLQNRVNANGGRVYPGYTPVVYLFVEIKCAVTSAGACADGGSATSNNNPLRVLAELESELTPYHGFLYSQTNTGAPVQVIVTGGHNGETHATTAGGTSSVRLTLHGESPHWVYLDGSPGTDSDVADGVVPLVSFQYPATTGPSLNNLQCGIDGSDTLTSSDSETDLLSEILNARMHGHAVRVWGLPDCPSRTQATDLPAYQQAREAAWRDVRHAGVDYLSSNHEQFLQDWLTENYSAAGLGGGACGAQQQVTSTVKAQICGLWADNVPVYSDTTGAVVGHLTEGGRANWFVAQEQRAEFCYSDSDWCNDWWAYTQADNGQWGWVPVVYFSGGENNQPADRLGSCLDVPRGLDFCPS